MSAGVQPTVAQVNASVGALALSLRADMEAVQNFAAWLNQYGGATALEALGFSTADATAIVTMAGYMNTVAGCYFGTVQQGGSNGTGAAQFNFNNALSVLWGAS